MERRQIPNALNRDGTPNTRTYPVVKCPCGKEVWCTSGWANQCECGEHEWNGGGQKLAPRSQWGEETGEQF